MPKHPADFKLELLLLAAILAGTIACLAALAAWEGDWEGFWDSTLIVTVGTVGIYLGLLIFEGD